jgi:aminoglycoside phosphotransferase (APT) family kinase protein
MTDSLQTLSRAVEQRLTALTTSAVTVEALKPLHGGACQDNYRVDLTVGGQPRRLALRSDAVTSLPGSLNREQEFEVIGAAVRAGVKTPAAQWLCKDLVRPGAHAYFLDWIDGEALGRRVIKAPELAEARAGLPAELGDVLSRIHSVTPGNAPLPFSNLDAVNHLGAAGAALNSIRAMLDKLPEVHPAVELAMRWLDDHAPIGKEVTLVHGDFRVGNFMVTPRGLSGVLDWEFAHFGDPMEDLAWVCVRDWRFGQLNMPVGGISRRQPFYEAYEKASGRRVDPNVVHYWEVMGNVRWAVGSVYQGERYLGGEEVNLELIAIARRATEMEFEALRLMEKGA